MKKSFLIFQTLGFHITKNHFYEPVPDTRTLKDELWLKKSDLIGLDLKEKNQLSLISEFSSKFKDEYEAFPKTKTDIKVPYQYYINNGGYESIDGEILYCMIRKYKPKKIIEIGSGNSTYLSAQAILKNTEENGHKCEFISIDPYPNDVIRAGFPGLSKVIPKKIQDIDLQFLTDLEENDILFIDSSHVLKIGSDVQYEFLEILPRLNKGVIIHVHDIFMPSEYRKELIFNQHKFWTEQYLLQAFLAFNDSFEILWAGSYMHLRNPDQLETAFNSYNRNERWPGSFWMMRTKDANV
jgi:predicted O-methyltransferase YrrM